MVNVNCPYYVRAPWSHGGEDCDDECHVRGDLGRMIIDQYGSTGSRDCDFEDEDYSLCSVYCATVTKNK